MMCENDWLKLSARLRAVGGSRWSTESWTSEDIPCNMLCARRDVTLQQYYVVSFEWVWRDGIYFFFPQKQTQVLDEVLVMPLPILTLVLSSVKAKEDDSCWLQRTFGRICFKVLSKNQVPELRYFLQPAIACKLILKLHNQFEIS